MPVFLYTFNIAIIIIEIIKVDTGDLAINNLSDYGDEFKFTGLTDKEELIVDCEHQEISVNLTNTWRYDNFNDKYLTLCGITPSS